jgi:hypothetical protein
MLITSRHMAAAAVQIEERLQIGRHAFGAFWRSAAWCGTCRWRRLVLVWRPHRRSLPHGAQLALRRRVWRNGQLRLRSVHISPAELAAKL